MVTEVVVIERGVKVRVVKDTTDRGKRVGMTGYTEERIGKSTWSVKLWDEPLPLPFFESELEEIATQNPRNSP